jgi:YebC/PmpR family DNA-binding regulatory protein
MPKENIERAIRRGSGADKDVQLEELFYEGYGPSGTALLIEVVTDNRNRALSDIRRAFTRGGGSLGEAGSVAWQFDTRGHLVARLNKVSQDQLFEWALDAGADDIQYGLEEADIYTNPEDFQAVREALSKYPLEITEAELTMLPKVPLALDVKETVQVMQLMENLEELDDVTRVYSNLEISEEALAEMELA